MHPTSQATHQPTTLAGTPSRGALVVLAGRPGTGKTTLARGLTAHTGAVHLRIDTVETALRRGGAEVGPLGYVVVHDQADELLRAGHTVVVDAVHPVLVSRDPWAPLADRHGVRLLWCETLLDDAHQHRRRVETRTPDLEGQLLPRWRDVEEGVWEPWNEGRHGPRLLVPTAQAPDAVALVLDALQA